MTNGKDALRRAQTAVFELFLSDYRMPEMNGVEFLSRIKDLQPEAVRLILSGYADLSALLGSINEAEIYRFINKPWEDSELIMTVEQALRYRDMLVENRRLADLVREQQAQLNRHEKILMQLEAESPGITKVNWAKDGSVLIDENEI